MAFGGANIPNAVGQVIGAIVKTESDLVARSLERVAIDFDQLNTGAVGAALLSQKAVNATSESAAVSCEGHSKILVKTEYSGATVYANVRVVLIGFDGNRLYLSRVTPLNTGDATGATQGGYFHGEAYAADVMGAKQFAVRIEGNGQLGLASVWAAAV